MALIYKLTGTLTNRTVLVDTDATVKLVLAGVTINNTNGAALVIENAAMK